MTRKVLLVLAALLAGTLLGGLACEVPDDERVEMRMIDGVRCAVIADYRRAALDCDWDHVIVWKPAPEAPDSMPPRPR